MGTRDRILDAAAHVMRTQGFAHATTKEIARAAGYSEATLYKHFRDKSELFLEVLHERLPSFLPFVAEFTKRLGEGTLRGNLIAIARSAMAFYDESFPMSASLFSNPELLAAHRAATARRDVGPHRPVREVANYLRLEQREGRVRADADCDAAAALLVGPCFQYAFLRSFAGRAVDPQTVEAHAVAFADTVLTGLKPAD